MNVTTFTDKHLSLADYLNESVLDDIENIDDVEFVYNDKYFWVLNIDEAKEATEKQIDDMLYYEGYFFKLSDLEKSGLNINDLKMFFLPDILTNDISFINEIQGTDLVRYINHRFTISDFIHRFTDYLFQLNLSGSILCSQNTNNINNGFYIYWR